MGDEEPLNYIGILYRVLPTGEDCPSLETLEKRCGWPISAAIILSLKWLKNTKYLLNRHVTVSDRVTKPVRAGTPVESASVQSCDIV